MSQRESGGVAEAFLSTFRVLHLVVQVLAPINTALEPEHDEWGSHRVELAWPRVQPLEWPLPEERMLHSDEDLFKLAESFRVRHLQHV